MQVTNTSGSLIFQAGLPQGHDEPPPLESHDDDQEETPRHANLLVWHLALSAVLFSIYCNLTGFDKLKSAVANCDVKSKLYREVNGQAKVAFNHQKDADLERGNQRRTGGEPRWPFLLRFPITTYGITLGLGSHVSMWKNIASLSPMESEHIPRVIGAIFWLLCLLHLLLITVIYSIKFVRWPKAVRLEFQHPVRSNFFAAPFISALFLIIGYPKLITGYTTKYREDSHSVLSVSCAFVFTALLLLYEVHIYGGWLLSRTHKLSEIANPTTQIAVIGNFVSATSFALAGWKEIALFLFTVGAMHQVVVFKVIYSRFTSDQIIGLQLRPTYFLFVAPPSVASIAWSCIHGSVDSAAAILSFMAVFFLVIMISRVSFFFMPGMRFSLAWWAFTFPSAAVSMSVLNYESWKSSSQNYLQMNHFNIPKIFSVSLILFSSLVLLGVFLCTIVQVISGQLFVNDQVVESVLDNVTTKGYQS